MDGTLLYVFARAPQAGWVKTRLIPSVGAEGAARLSAAFIEDVCALSRGVAERRVLAIAGDENDQFLVEVAAREGMMRVAQRGADLGARMAWAIEEGLAAGAARVAIIGSDSPVLPPQLIRDALAMLSGDTRNDVVIGPAEDGGYWLVGARRPVPWLFEGIQWGTKTVMEETVRRLEGQRVDYGIAERFWDVDEPSDLVRLKAALDGDLDGGRAQATRMALSARMGFRPVGGGDGG